MLYLATQSYTFQTERLANVTEFNVDLTSRPYLSIRNPRINFVGQSPECYLYQLTIDLANAGSVPLDFNITANNSANGILENSEVSINKFVLFPTESTTIFFPPTCTKLQTLDNNTVLGIWDKEVLVDVKVDYNRINDSIAYYRTLVVQFYNPDAYYLINQSAN